MAALRVLSSSDIYRAVTVKEIIEPMRIAFSDLTRHQVCMPLRTEIVTEENNGTILFMPTYSDSIEHFSIKVVSLFDNNPQRGLPFIQGILTLMDSETGTPHAIMDGATLTAYRCGATSGLATDLLANPEAKTCSIFGSGLQGKFQLEGVCAVRDIEQIMIYDLFPESAERFAVEMSEKLKIPITVAKTPKEATSEMDVICTATISDTPVFDDADLKPGVHINALGSYKPHVQEIPGETVVRSKLVVDHCESALEETGDLIIPINQGLMTEAHIWAELGELVLHRIEGRTSPEEITLFKSVGVAVQDLAAAAMILQRAEKKDIGTLIDM